jgi:hypothetical protein
MYVVPKSQAHKVIASSLYGPHVSSWSATRFRQTSQWEHDHENAKSLTSMFKFIRHSWTISDYLQATVVCLSHLFHILRHVFFNVLCNIQSKELKGTIRRIQNGTKQMLTHISKSATFALRFGDCSGCHHPDNSYYINLKFCGRLNLL